MKFDRIFLFVVLALALLLPATISAQDDCYGLSPADYALFTDFGPKEPASFALNFMFYLRATGDEPVNMTLTGEGNVSFTGDPDPLKAFNAQLTFAVTGEEAFESEMRVIDGMLYGFDHDTQQWKYTPLEKIMDASGMAFDFGLAQMGNLSGMIETILDEMGVTGDAIRAHFGVQRLPGDASVNGINVAVFDASLDLPGLFSDPAFGVGLAEMGDEDAENLQMGLMMLAMLFEDMELGYEVYIAPDTGYFHGFDLEFSMSFDPAMLGEGGSAEPVEVFAKARLEISDYGKAFEYAAPPDAVQLTEAELQELDM